MAVGKGIVAYPPGGSRYAYCPEAGCRERMPTDSRQIGRKDNFLHGRVEQHKRRDFTGGIRQAGIPVGSVRSVCHDREVRHVDGGHGAPQPRHRHEIAGIGLPRQFQIRVGGSVDSYNLLDKFAGSKIHFHRETRDRDGKKSRKDYIFCYDIHIPGYIVGHWTGKDIDRNPESVHYQYFRHFRV